MTDQLIADLERAEAILRDLTDGSANKATYYAGVCRRAAERLREMGVEVERLQKPIESLDRPTLHKRNCAAWIDSNGYEVNGEACTCGFKFRKRIIELENWLGTERTMHAAWRKRASEAESKLRAVEGLLGKLHREGPGVESPEFCGCGNCSQCGYWEGKGDVADELESILRGEQT